MSRYSSVIIGLKSFVGANSCLHVDTFVSHCSSFLLVLYYLFGFLALPLVLWVLGLLLWSMMLFEALSVGEWGFGS